MSLFEQAALGLRRETPDPPRVVAAVVTRSDATGVWATPTGQDTQHPLGPLRGATRLLLVAVGTSYELQLTPLPEGVGVLIVNTDDGPWVLNWEA